MQVICIDGTVLQCDRFEAIDSGVLLFNEQRQQRETEEAEDEEADEELEAADEAESDEADAFVPLHQLRMVLPEGTQPGPAAGQSRGQTTSQPPTQAPPTGTGMAPQGQMQQQQSSRGQPSPQGGSLRQGLGQRRR